jgi:hypothetical protein
MVKNFYQRFKEKYFERKPIFTEEQRNQFEKGLGNFVNNCDIQYGRGSITLKFKDKKTYN